MLRSVLVVLTLVICVQMFLVVEAKKSKFRMLLYDLGVYWRKDLFDNNNNNDKS